MFVNVKLDIDVEVSDDSAQPDEDAQKILADALRDQVGVKLVWVEQKSLILDQTLE